MQTIEQKERCESCERLRALLREAIPHIEGSLNTTSVETYNAANGLLGRARETLGDVEQLGSKTDG